LFNRRGFLKTSAAAGAATAAATTKINGLHARTQDTTGYFSVHPFIENNPDAVFIMRTNIDVKTNSDAKKNAGLSFGRSVFVPSETGVPLTHLIPIKPNLTSFGSSTSTLEQEMGILTDVFFVEGVIEGMKELGISGEQFFLREVNYGSHVKNHGWEDMAARVGAEIRSMTAKVGVISENDLVWRDVLDGKWYRKIPYLWPINAPDTFLLNIAKFKAHGMGITLSAKNLQGSIAHNYQAHCSGFNMDMDTANHRNPAAIEDITANHALHLEAGVPRWDRPGSNWNTGLGMETWASRCLDNNSVTECGLHIIEGIYGRDGNFKNGPHMSDGTVDLNSTKGLAEDYMANIIIFGKNQFNNDIIGHWLAGHEPGNFGLFHMAIDRGMSSYLNPFDIPVYEWKDGEAVLTPLTDFEKTPLLTYYLQRNYDGQTEDYWHFVDEPYDYGPVSVDNSYNGRPEAFVLHQNRPNPFNPNTSIQFDIPSNGHIRLEVYNTSGQLVNVLVDGYRTRGSHMAVWNTNGHSSGVYFYRLRFNGHSETKKMILMK